MEDINLNLLKRRDPDAEQILGTSVKVTMYIMAVETQKWERRNVEGTLYVVKRRSHPRFQLVVLNKLSTENYVEAIESGFHAEVSPPYLIYTQGGGKVHGVWFYEEGDLTKIANLLAKVEASLPKPSQPLPAAAAVTQANGQQDDGGFWDKPAAAAAAAAEAKAAAQATAAAAPPPPGGDTNAITNLFKNMQVKKESAPPPPPAMSPPAASVVALPPSFFQPQQPQQQQPHQQQAPAPPGGGGPGALLHHKHLDHLRAAAALSPASSADMGSFTAGQAQPDMLSKLFAPKPAPAAPPPGAPPAPPLILPQPQAPLPPQPQQPAPPAPGGNALTALFTNSSNNSAAASAMAAAAAGAAATPPRPGGAPPGGRLYDERLRTALSRLVQREEVLAALAEELRAVGLVP